MASWRGSTRGVSNVVGYVLVVGLVVGGVALTVSLGAAAFEDVQEQAKLDRAENTMTLLDGRISSVALGASPRKSVQFPGGDGGNLNVVNDTGRVVVMYENDTLGEQTLINRTLGAVTYEVGDSEVAYQGGGVWQRTGDYSTIVSVPEFHYRNATLTFPLVRVSGTTSTISGTTLQVQSNGTERVFPNATRQNPLSGGEITVRITSAYHHGWARYFTERTDGSVTHDPANETVAVTLTVPVVENFENAVATTENGSSAITTTGNANFDSPKVTGYDAPLPDRAIDQRIEECEAGGCADLSSELPTLDSGTYYVASSTTIGTGTEFNTSTGDVTVVVNGSLTFDGTSGPGNVDQSVTGDNGTVYFYVKGDATVKGNAAVNTGGNASDVVMLVHSTASSVAAASGTPQFTGVIYAPGTNLTINGGGACGTNGNGNGNGNSGCQGNIVGSAIVQTANAVGGGNLVYPSLGITIEFDGLNEITFLHITENRITVSEE